MTRVAVVGCTGKFGSMIANMILQEKDMKLAYAIGRAGSSHIGKDISEIVGGKPKDIPIIDDIGKAVDCDVFIDSTNATALIEHNLDKYKHMNKPLIIATTGFDLQGKEKIQELSQFIPVFISGNFSIALYDFIETIKFAARKLRDDTDVQLIEYHHKYKKDAPSGTALMILDALTSANPKLSLDNIKVFSIRSGTIFGEHVVMFSNTKDEVIQYRHQASSRVSFATGALSIATWMMNKPIGLYTMENYCNNIDKE